MNDDLRHPGWKGFQCQPDCGRCCGIRPDIGLDEYARIAEFLGLPEETFVERYIGRLVGDPVEVERLWKEDRENDVIQRLYGPTKPPDRLIDAYPRAIPCPFLTAERRCGIHSVRPDACRLYPFQTDFGRGGIDCPGIDALPTDGPA